MPKDSKWLYFLSLCVCLKRQHETSRTREWDEGTSNEREVQMKRHSCWRRKRTRKTVSYFSGLFMSYTHCSLFLLQSYSICLTLSLTCYWNSSIFDDSYMNFFLVCISLRRESQREILFIHFSRLLSLFFTATGWTSDTPLVLLIFHSRLQNIHLFHWIRWDIRFVFSLFSPVSQKHS